MKIKVLFSIFLASLLAVPAVYAGEERTKAKEEDRLENAGKVMKEILNVPDDIPQDLLDKAKCVVVMPSVIKAAFVAGGSYGRGAMVCRGGRDFRGSWVPPQCTRWRAEALVSSWEAKRLTSCS